MVDKIYHAVVISIHALREEGDPSAPHSRSGLNISIHALREEGDIIGIRGPVLRQISIHALREEGDCNGRQNLSCSGYFYPRPPRGGRPVSSS